MNKATTEPTLREELSENAARRERLIESAQRLNRIGHDVRSEWMLRLAEDIYAEVRDAR
jgi:hypothetical protein